MNIQAFISCRLSAPNDGTQWTLPVDIQYMPPGRSRVTASSNGKAVTVDIECTEEDAEKLNTQLQAMLEAAEKGTASRPFIDFDHEGNEAAAIPKRIFWQDGLRLECDWTKAGEEALSGRVYSYFSPEIVIEKATGRVSRLPEHGPIGSLVNTPAFQHIERIAAKHGEDNLQSASNGDQTPNDTKPITQADSISDGDLAAKGKQKTNNKHKDIPMEKLLAALVSAKLIPSAKLEDAEAADIFSAAWKQKQEEVTALNDKVANLETSIQAGLQKEAESFIAQAVKEGKIKDETTLKAKWVSAYLKDVEGTKTMLDGVETKPARGAAPPPPADADESKELAEIRAEMATNKDPVKAGELALKARKLRGHDGIFDNQ